MASSLMDAISMSLSFCQKCILGVLISNLFAAQCISSGFQLKGTDPSPKIKVNKHQPSSEQHLQKPTPLGVHRCQRLRGEANHYSGGLGSPELSQAKGSGCFPYNLFLPSTGKMMLSGWRCLHWIQGTPNNLSPSP